LLSACALRNGSGLPLADVASVSLGLERRLSASGA
jgi:hypothetical protein